MTYLKRLALAVVVPAALVSLAIPGVASAKAGDQTMAQTIPVSASVCAKVAAGTEGPRVKKNAVPVAAACTILQAAFTAAQTTVLASRATIEPQMIANRTAINTACPTPTHQPVTCHAVRVKDVAANKALKEQLRLAVKSYFVAVDTARRAFWHTFRSLPGLGVAHADAPIDIKKSVQKQV